MEKPYISPEQQLPELTVKVVILSIVLTAILAMSNAYLALKVGLLTSASIPAAIISMGLLRFVKGSNILQNNLVQTAASAGEAVAGGIVYAVPAFILIHYWDHFSYWQNFLIALVSGLLGVLFAIPIRHVLVTQPTLKFPEGRAIAEVLITGDNRALGLKELVLGGMVGAAIELAQTGFKIVANHLQVWFLAGRSLVGFGAGFSATMIGAGYLIGFNAGLSVLIGALLGWFIAVPILSEVYHVTAQGGAPTDLVMALWGQKIRYIGIGAMIVTGVWSLVELTRPFVISIGKTLRALLDPQSVPIPRTERDIPLYYVAIGMLMLLFALYYLMGQTIAFDQLGVGASAQLPLAIVAVLYVLFIGFILSALCGYLSGLVGVTTSPGSAIMILGVIIAAVVLRFYLQTQGVSGVDNKLMAVALLIFVGASIISAACLTNDTIQDFKVGQLVGATPWKQQVMLMLGVLVAAAVIPLVMQLLFNVYGIGDVLPDPSMKLENALPAPPAALLAAVSQAVLDYNLPWDMVELGIVVGIAAILVNLWLKRRGKTISVVAVAVGIYLPLSTSVPLFFGGLLAYFTGRKLHDDSRINKKRRQMGMLLACGLVTGAALMDVVLAVPLALAHSADAFSLLANDWMHITEILGIATTLGLSYWFYRTVTRIEA